MEIINGIKKAVADYKAQRAENLTKERIREKSSEFQATEYGGNIYIIHKGTPIRRFSESESVDHVTACLEEFRKTAIQFNENGYIG